MKWYTHAAAGANVVWLTTLFGEPTQASAFYIALGAFAALLPDIDASWRGAKIHYVAGGILGGLKGVFRHRGFFHSFICIDLLFLLTLPFGWFYDPFIPLIITSGYASHPFIDCWNAGMQWFYPLKTNVTFVPKFLRFRVGSSGDTLFFVMGVLGLVVFVFSYLPILTAMDHASRL